MITLLLAVSALAAPPTPSVRSAALRDQLPGVSLGEAQVIPFAGGDRVRVRPTFEGLPVDDADRVVVLRGDAVARVVGAPLGPVTGAREVSERVAIAVADAVPLGVGVLWPSRATPVVWGGDGDARRAWRVERSTARPMGTWRMWVDAETGALLGARPTSFSSDADVYLGDPLDSDVSTVTLAGLVADDALLGEHADVWSCEQAEVSTSLIGSSLCAVAARHATPDAAGDYRFAPAPEAFDDPFAEVQLYHHLDRVAQWAQDTWRFRRGAPTRGYVNFTMANAFFGDFDGDGVGDVAFGQADNGVDLAYDRDVVYHEFGHAIVEGVANLGFLDATEVGLAWDGGALNEGTADVIALLLTEDPAIGAYAGGAFDQEAIRDVGQRRRCPDDLVGEAHADGRIWGNVFWRLIQSDSVGPDLSAALLMGAISTWGPDTTWEIAGQSLLDAAVDLVDSGDLSVAGMQAVLQVVSDANLVACDRVVPLDDGASHDTLLVYTGLPGVLEIVPGEVQYAIDIPEDATAARLVISDWSDGDAVDIGYRVHARYDEPVGHDVVDMFLFGIHTAVPARFDASRDGEGVGNAFGVGPGRAIDLRPGHTLYFSLASRPVQAADSLTFTFARATLHAEIDRERRGGCACDGTSAPLSGIWLGVGALALAVGRRRRASDA